MLDGQDLEHTVCDQGDSELPANASPLHNIPLKKAHTPTQWELFKGLTV